MRDAVAGADNEVAQLVPAPRSAGPYRLGAVCHRRGWWFVLGPIGRSGRRLIAPGRLKELGINDELYLNLLTKHVAGGGADHVGELFLQPLLVEVVGHADEQLVVAVVPGELGFIRKPKQVTWLPNALANGLPQRRHDRALAGRHGYPPGAQNICERS